SRRRMRAGAVVLSVGAVSAKSGGWTWSATSAGLRLLVTILLAAGCPQYAASSVLVRQPADELGRLRRPGRPVREHHGGVGVHCDDPVVDRQVGVRVPADRGDRRGLVQRADGR